MAIQHSTLTDDPTSSSSSSPPTESALQSKPLLPRQIPWGYGKDRVTAVPVDPIQLFIYWELRDEAIERARAQLGPSGARANLVLRIYDTSGRIFDGTNAHSSFLRSPEGRFLKIVRSGRVDFPRADPAPPRPAEWMRVVASTGAVVSREVAHGGPRPAPANYTGGDAGAAGGGGMNGWWGHDFEGSAIEQHGSLASIDGFEFRELEPGTYELEHKEWSWDSGWQSDEMDPSVVHRMLTTQWEEFGFSTSSWQTTPIETAWEAGPFNYPTEVVVPTAQRFEAPTQVYKVGEQVRVLHGPWQIVIRGIQPRSSHRVIARWEVHRTWVNVTPRSVTNGHTAPGAGTHPVGSSERFALSASELRLRGASEVFYLAASERRLGGASETRFIAASQFMARGASERRFIAASEWRLGGASERRFAGASERRLGGASERMMLGASERRFAGASERRLGGASERRPGMSEPRLTAFGTKSRED
jgi:hypothetical protein